MRYNYTISNNLARNLMAIEASKERINLTILPPSVMETLRRKAKIRSTHYSTLIEGNRLTLAEAQRVVTRGVKVNGKERDVAEVNNYYSALSQVEKWTESRVSVTEERIRKLHAIIHDGIRVRPTKYRTGQNVIKDSSTGQIVYMPPEAKDVAQLMGELVDWMDFATAESVPIPIIAGMAHYQFVTIHPFYDGNGRTARTLATWILYRGGYDIGKFYSLEEFYANDMDGYYAAFRTHPKHNYYSGRYKADISPWLEYFVRSMAAVFSQVAEEVTSRSGKPQGDLSPIRDLDRRARIVLGLFSESSTVTTGRISRALGLSERQCRDLIKRWISDGLLVIVDKSNKKRTYGLAAEYQRFVNVDYDEI